MVTRKIFFGDGDGDKKIFFSVTVTVTKKVFFGDGDGEKKLFFGEGDGG